jgi:hypothetical protein
MCGTTDGNGGEKKEKKKEKKLKKERKRNCLTDERRVKYLEKCVLVRLF